jgi:hypothetical protein
MRARLIRVGAALIVLAALAGGGVAWATAGDDDENVTGPGADKARAAALAHVGDGRVIAVERESEEGAAWEVEVARADGSMVEVVLDADFGVVATANEEDEDKSGEDGE